jgi:hypothetical protein
MRSLVLPLLLVRVASALACRSGPAPDAQPAPSAATLSSPAMTASTAVIPGGEASASTAAPVPSSMAGTSPSGLPPLPRHVPVLRAESCAGDSTSPWLEARFAAARSGRREIVRLPYSVGMFWGCSCPMDYICMSPVETFATAFSSDARLAGTDLRRGIRPDPSRPAETGTQAGIVEGWIDKERLQQWWGEGGEHKLWKQLVFEVWHARAFASEAESSNLDAYVVAELDDDELFVPRLHDERPWLVILATLTYERPHVDDEAQTVRARAVAAGLSDAEVIDSRQTDALFCCSRVVVAGRYESKKAADAALPRARHTSPGAYVSSSGVGIGGTLKNATTPVGSVAVADVLGRLLMK